MAAQVGQAAPDFTMVSTELKPMTLKDFAGKNVVLAFYPAAFTGVCQKELCTFRDAIKKYDVVFDNLAGVQGFTVAKRAVFVIDKSGTVRYRWFAPEPKVEPNYDEVNAAVKHLR
jgi:glutaredoxin-dependent peroxiredoxin